MPIVLHWGWEVQDGWEDLERFAGMLASYAAPWEDFLAVVERNRSTPAVPTASRVER